MLQDKYLPHYHFNEKHDILITRSPQEIYQLIDKLDFSESKVIRLLFALRGMPARMMNKKGLEKNGIVELEKKKDDEIIIGLIGQFWRPSGNLQKFRPDEFIPFSAAGFAKASWNFQLIPESDKFTRLETETRIYCLDEKTKKSFSRYWFLIRPFSGMIRNAVLRSIKRKAEQN